MILPVQKDEELMTDFREADKVTGAIHVWSLGHCGFLLKWDGYGLLLDPYLSDSVTRNSEGTAEPINRISERVVDPLMLKGIDYLVCSNNNPDRLDPETILPPARGQPWPETRPACRKRDGSGHHPRCGGASLPSRERRHLYQVRPLRFSWYQFRQSEDPAR